MISISHGEGGFKYLGRYLQSADKDNAPPVVILEATGHYHRGLATYLERNGWTYFIVNPLQAKRAKGTQLRKVKTDRRCLAFSRDVLSGRRYRASYLG